MRTNLTWAELGCLVLSAEAAKRRFRSWAKTGTFDRLMQRSQPVAAPDVLHVDSTSAFASETQASSATGLRRVPAAAGRRPSPAAGAG